MCNKHNALLGKAFDYLSCNAGLDPVLASCLTAKPPSTSRTAAAAAATPFVLRCDRQQAALRCAALAAANLTES
jgi:hypothetical protein